MICLGKILLQIYDCDWHLELEQNSDTYIHINTMCNVLYLLFILLLVQFLVFGKEKSAREAWSSFPEVTSAFST